MTPKEYFDIVARCSQHAEMTGDYNSYKEVVEFLLKLMNRNIAPEVAALLMIEKFKFPIKVH